MTLCAPLGVKNPHKGTLEHIKDGMGEGWKPQSWISASVTCLDVG